MQFLIGQYIYSIYICNILTEIVLSSLIVSYFVDDMKLEAYCNAPISDETKTILYYSLQGEPGTAGPQGPQGLLGERVSF